MLGTQIYYTGDMANPEGFFTVVKVNPADKWGGESYDLMEQDCEREFRRVYAYQIDTEYTGPSGTRFVTYAAWMKYRADKLKALLGLRGERIPTL